MSFPGISVIIPSWNGRALLEKCLPAVLESLKACGRDCEIIVVDDASTDGTMEWLAAHCPAVRQVRIPQNRGFVHAANQGLAAAVHDYVCLLNNDMTVDRDFFEPLALALDADERAFAVSAKAIEADTDRLNIGARLRRIENLEIRGAGEETDAPGLCHTLFASGGASLFRAQAVNDLGGLDTLYEPFYIEDTDLSYRAWKRGWRVLYEPRAAAVHIGGASITRKGAAPLVRLVHKLRASAVIHRNAILFYIKNITDPDLWAAYRRRIFLWAASNAVRMRWAYLLGLAAALPRVPAALRARRIELAQCTVTDRQLFETLNSGYESPPS